LQPIWLVEWQFMALGWQEPGEDSEIQSFCSLNYNVTFPVLSKIQVNGNDTHPVYQFLKTNAPSAEGSGIMSAAMNLSSAMYVF
jgi:glutathione peroxidase-family protein